MSPTSTAFIHLEAAAKAAEASRFPIVLTVVTEGIKVSAPRHGHLKSPWWIVGWSDLESAIGNPLIRAIAKVEAEL